MEDKKMIKPLQDKLLQHRVDVPGDLWMRVSDALPSPIVWYKRRLFYVAVAVISLLLGVAWCLYDFTDPACPDTENLVCQESHAIDDTKSAYCVEEGKGSRSITENVSEVLLEKKECVAICTDTAMHECVAEILAPKENLPNDEHEPALAMLGNATSCGDLSIPCQSDSLYAAYFESKRACFDDVAVSSIKNECGGRDDHTCFFAFEANTSARNTVVTPYLLRCSSGQLTFTHRMPFTARALFEKRFGRWGVGTGVSYTYMGAEYEDSNNYRKGLQQLHYVGIPLYASFEFARVEKFAFYASLGGQMDINTAGIQRESDESVASQYFDKLEFREETMQFSLQLRVGVAYEIVEHLDIFMEPVLGYYFANTSTVHSRWNDSPFTGSIAMGLRAWL